MFGIEGSISPTTNTDVKLPKLTMSGQTSGRIINTEIEVMKKNNLMKSYESRKMSRDGNNEVTFSQDRNNTVQNYENFG